MTLHAVAKTKSNFLTNNRDHRSEFVAYIFLNCWLELSRLESVYSTPKIFGAEFENSWRSGVRSSDRLPSQVSAQVVKALAAGLISFWSHIYEGGR